MSFTHILLPPGLIVKRNNVSIMHKINVMHRFFEDMGDMGDPVLV